LVSAAAAIAAHKVNKPVRVVLDLRSNMEMFGKRLPYMGKYKVRT
jgi:xanthine dehydrogenase/oxidase